MNKSTGKRRRSPASVNELQELLAAEEQAEERDVLTITTVSAIKHYKLTTRDLVTMLEVHPGKLVLLFLFEVRGRVNIIVSKYLPMTLFSLPSTESVAGTARGCKYEHLHTCHLPRV
jgi:hypothetical protein